MKNLAPTMERFAVYVRRSDGTRSHFAGYIEAPDNATACRNAYAMWGNPHGYDAEPAEEGITHA